ncbi:S8 family serine peptidase [Kitasatospora sp. NPDC058243]|uniref:S8 family serine peptidase n=1 Tax=Kitasatospora sp. NPDC058243 TaxID=3346397 RepID=UPI0036D7CD5E
MGRTNTRVRWQMLAAALLAGAALVGAVETPAVADGSIRADQWHLDAMHASEMWKISKGDGITVAVIDGGFKMDHPDLVGQFLPGMDFSGSPGGVGFDPEGHGTQMASLIAGSGKAKGGNGAYGLAPGVKILPLKISNGTDGALVSADFIGQIGQAITYAVEQGVKVINISQGISAVRTSPSDVAKLNSIIAMARAKGSLIVSSVGNSAQSGNLVEYPGALPNVVGVGAVGRDVIATAESQQGPQVILAAPGVDMIEACTGPTGYCKSHGTSDSTALVSASAALIWSIHRDWSANQVLRVLINTAGKPTDGSVRNNDVGYGVVRPRVALADPGDPGPADVSPVPAAETVPSASPSAPASPSATSAPSPSSAVPSPSDVAVGAPPVEPRAEKSSGSGGALPVVAGVVGGLVLVAGVVFVVLRRRKAGGRPVVPPGEDPYVR